MHDGGADGQFREVADDEFGVNGLPCRRSRAFRTVTEDLRFCDKREVRQEQTPVDVGYGERQPVAAVEKRLEVVHFRRPDA